MSSIAALRTAKATMVADRRRLSTEIASVDQSIKEIDNIIERMSEQPRDVAKVATTAATGSRKAQAGKAKKPAAGKTVQKSAKAAAKTKSVAKKKAKTTKKNAKFFAWAETMKTWRDLAKQVGIGYTTALALRDGAVPQMANRQKIEKVSKGAVPVESWS